MTERPWLFVGAKVVCVDGDSDSSGWGGENRPVTGETYTVRKVIEWNGEIGLLVEEIRNPHFAQIGEYGFRAWRFRPVLPDTSKQIEEMKRLMRDHVANASGGMGIKRKVRA